jgi:hypothetical protein
MSGFSSISVVEYISLVELPHVTNSSLGEMASSSSDRLPRSGSMGSNGQAMAKRWHYYSLSMLGIVYSMCIATPGPSNVLNYVHEIVKSPCALNYPLHVVHP